MSSGGGAPPSSVGELEDWVIDVTDDGVKWPTSLVEIIQKAGRAVPEIKINVTQQQRVNIEIQKSVRYGDVPLRDSPAQPMGRLPSPDKIHAAATIPSSTTTADSGKSRPAKGEAAINITPEDYSPDFPPPPKEPHTSLADHLGGPAARIPSPAHAAGSSTFASGSFAKPMDASMSEEAEAEGDGDQGSQCAEDPGQQEIFSSDSSGRVNNAPPQEASILIDDSDEDQDQQPDEAATATEKPTLTKEDSMDSTHDPFSFDAALKQSGKDLNLPKPTKASEAIPVSDSPRNGNASAAGVKRDGATLGSFATDPKRTKASVPSKTPSAPVPSNWQSKKPAQQQPPPRINPMQSTFARPSSTYSFGGASASAYAFGGTSASAGGRSFPPSFKQRENMYEGMKPKTSSAAAATKASPNDEPAVREARRISKFDSARQWKKILGLATKGKPDLDEARKAYHSLSRILHPDKIQVGHPEESLLKSAYDTVRAAWDSAQAGAAKPKKGSKKK